MDKNSKDGGSVTPALFDADGRLLMDPSGGLSLRDYFAAMALQGIMAAQKHSSFEYLAPHDAHSTWVPETAYLLADAMLAARERKEGK